MAAPLARLRVEHVPRRGGASLERPSPSKPTLRLDPLAAPHGSVALSRGGTRVLAAVYGPLHADRAASHESAVLETSIKHTAFACAASDTAAAATTDHHHLRLAHELRAALEPSVRLDRYPKSKIAVHVLVLQDDGGVLAAAITCASLALSRAGIEMYDLVAASSVALVDGRLLLDGSTADEIASAAITVVAGMQQLQQLTLVSSSGAMPPDVATDALRVGLEGCRTLDVTMRETLRASVDDTSDT